MKRKDSPAVTHQRLPLCHFLLWFRLANHGRSQT